MADNVEYELQQISSRVEDLERSVARIAELLETISDGLFELNLHVGAGVEAWTGGRTAAVTSEITPGTGPVKWYDAQKGVGMIVRRSEEHTYELQSLRSISDAVFRLKTKHTINN